MFLLTSWWRKEKQTPTNQNQSKTSYKVKWISKFKTMTYMNYHKMKKQWQIKSWHWKWKQFTSILQTKLASKVNTGQSDNQFVKTKLSDIKCLGSKLCKHASCFISIHLEWKVLIMIIMWWHTCTCLHVYLMTHVCLHFNELCLCSYDYVHWQKQMFITQELQQFMSMFHRIIKRWVKRYIQDVSLSCCFCGETDPIYDIHLTLLIAMFS